MADFLMLFIEVLGIILITAIVVVGLFAGAIYTYVTLAYMTLEEKLSEGWAIGGASLILFILLSILLTFIIHFGGVEP